MSNRNHKNWSIEAEKGRIQVAGFAPFCLLYYFSISRILPIDILVFIAAIAT
jgi:hypothetical protein